MPPKKKAKHRRTRRQRKPIDAQKLAQLRQKRKIRSLFARIGFSHIPADAIEFTFEGRTGELDDIFQYENILVLCEYTVGKTKSEHVTKKSILFSKIQHNAASWVKEYSQLNDSFRIAIKSSDYNHTEYRVAIIYVSAEGVSEEIESAFIDLRFLDGTRLRYFELLSHTVHRSARHEFFKYLGVDYSEIGAQILSTANTSRSFSGHLLPEAHSNYPKGFKVVSFYADPETLLALSYVLRQDSWRDSDGLYQRILIRSKIARMRRYLVEVQRVFVNNIIVTLPPDTRINQLKAPGINVDPATLDKAAEVSVSIPYSANMIGLVDGQHRVFCYYEGRDAHESQIAALRRRQNLLVTGLIFPEEWSDTEKRQFEARLFLEINDNQAKAKSDLKQTIELILNPLSTTAISKEIVNRLAAKGPLEDLLQTHFFDPPNKIKTTSIVSYGLRPLVKLEGDDSLFSAWSDSGKAKLTDGGTSPVERKEILERYILFCLDTINAFLIAMKLKTGPEKWRLMETRKAQFLNPTVLNGFFVCIRRLAEKSNLSSRETYERKLVNIDTFNFSKYRSSGWRAMGDDIYARCFSP